MSDVPADLKPIGAYLARAKELATAEPVISYWATYYALQQALNIGAKSAESSTFLVGLMDKLEAMKQQLADNEAVTDDAAAAVYVRNFGVALFQAADNEDRAGKATRLTAKKFLAAANFIELLSIFGEIPSENLDKVKYAKWKASDIAKAFREGRKPVPGPAGGLAEDEELGSTEVSPDEAKELAKELAALGSTEERSDALLGVGSPAQSTRSSITAVSPPAASTPPSAPDSYPFPDSSSVPILSPGPIPEEYEQPQTPAFPSFLNTPTTTPGEPREGESGTPTPPADAPPPLPPTHQTSDLAPPPFHSPSAPPAFPSAVLPTAPTLPHPAPSAPTPPAPPPHVTHVTHTAVPESLDPMVIASIQKHAKWAISALNYDDLDTARKELRAALAMLGG